MSSFEEGHVFGDAFAHRVRSAGDRRIAECNNAIFDVVLRHHCQGRLGETLEKLRRRPCRRPAAAFGGRDLDVSRPDLERRFIVALSVATVTGRAGPPEVACVTCQTAGQAFSAGCGAACFRPASSR